MHRQDTRDADCFQKPSAKLNFAEQRNFSTTSSTVGAFASRLFLPPFQRFSGALSHRWRRQCEFSAWQRIDATRQANRESKQADGDRRHFSDLVSSLETNLKNTSHGRARDCGRLCADGRQVLLSLRVSGRSSWKIAPDYLSLLRGSAGFSSPPG